MAKGPTPRPASRDWSAHAADQAQLSRPGHAAHPCSPWGTPCGPAWLCGASWRKGLLSWAEGHGQCLAGASSPEAQQMLFSARRTESPWGDPTLPRATPHGPGKCRRDPHRPDLPCCWPPGAGSPARSVTSPPLGRVGLATPHPTGDVTCPRSHSHPSGSPPGPITCPSLLPRRAACSRMHGDNPERGPGGGWGQT